MNAQLLILISITSIIILVVVYFKKSITLSEGVITLLMTNVILVLIWSMAIRVIMQDTYDIHTKIVDVSLEVEQNVDGTYLHKWNLYSTKSTKSANPKIIKTMIYSKQSNVDYVVTPRDIVTEYINKPTYVTRVPFINVYDNLGQYTSSTFRLPKSNFIIGHADQVKALNLTNAQLETLAITHGTNVHIVITSPNVTLHQIINTWKGVKLNEVLIHLHVYENVLRYNDIYTWGNGVQNESFLRIIQSDLKYIDLQEDDALLELLYKYLPLFKLPNPNVYATQTKYIKPGIWIIMTLILLSLFIATGILYLMSKFNRDK